jgi:hypothetical protein
VDYDPISSLEAVGYLEREASFLYLVAVHSGYFLRRQFSHFIRNNSGAAASRFLEKTLRLQHVRIIECGQGRHVYHLAAKPVYEALGRPDSQNRRLKGDLYIKSRLMILDFLLTHLDVHVLESEAGKVDFFTTQCGIRSELLPRSYAGRVMYFPDGFPILLSKTGIPSFTFFDEGQMTSTCFERYLRQYQPLFVALGEFELVFISGSESNSARARAVFYRFLPANRVQGVTPITPLGADHFLRFLVIRQQSEVGGRGVSAEDLSVLREGEGIYSTLEHQAIYAAWKLGATTEEKIRQRFLQSSTRVNFSTVFLPYSYPVSALRRSRVSKEGEGTPQQPREETHETEA